MTFESTTLDADELQTLRTLVRLLDDPDEDVGTSVVQRMTSMGPRIAPQLRELMHTDQHATTRMRAADVMHTFQRRALQQLVVRLASARLEGGDVDLEEGMFLLDAFGRPDADHAKVHAYLDELALRTHERFITMQPANDLTQLLSIHTVLFEEEQFTGATENYHDPANSYITSVIEHRHGIPIALCALELLLADRAGLELRGVAMPYHFVLYCPEIELFVDAFHGGVLLHRDECRAFIEKAGVTFRDDMLRPVSNVDILIRMMRNLAYAHAKAGQEWEAAILHETLETLQ